MTDHFAGETEHWTEAARVRSSAPTLRHPAEGTGARLYPLESREAEERLQSDAAREARKWKLCARPKGDRTLERKWRKAAESIQNASDQLRQLALAGDLLSEDARWLRDNSRLLKSSLPEARVPLKTLRILPWTETEQGQKVPRPYAAATAFLGAAGFVFQEQAFVTYFRAAQEAVGPFQIGELWELRAMMQLVLLEEVGNISERLRREVEARASSGASASTHPAEPAERAGSPQDAPPARLPKLITSLRDMGSAEWKELFEELSEVQHVLREDPSGVYPRMDAESRNLYRGAVAELAREGEASEPEVAQKAIALARAAQKEWSSDSSVRERRSHVGYYLIDAGRELLKKQIRYRAPFPKQLEEAIRSWPEVFYLVGIELVTFAIIAFLLNGLSAPVPLIAGIVLLLLPATESAVGVMNQLTTFLLRPGPLPKLDFSNGIPPDFTTMVVVPTVLHDQEHVRRMVRDLEIRYLANRDGNLHFALLTDFPDSSQPLDDQGELVALCSTLVRDLNLKYQGDGQDSEGSFFLFHRQRVYNPSEGVWMGWERKRGKLLDFNNLLRHKSDSFPVKVGDLSVLERVRYVITLDSDTQLPRGTASRLIGTLAHPLNRAVVDPVTETVVEGYGILQPRVGISVQSAGRSRLASIYSGQTAFDIYTRATSDVYQDLFGEGSFTGKGIYEVDVFQRVLANRFPCNAILSHDLIEGAYARAGLVSDVEVIDDYPSHFSAWSRRKHRWVRGDWQVMRWLLPRVRDYFGNAVANPLSVISRWKILDNLRRSLIETATFALLLAGWFFLPGGPVHWTVATLVLLLIPAYVELLLALSRLGREENRAGFLKETGAAFVAGQVNAFFMLAFLSHQTLLTLDAIVRTVVRLAVTRKRLLEWETAAQAESGTARKTPVDLYLGWTLGLSVVIATALAEYRPGALPIAAPVLFLWASARPLSRWLNRALPAGKTEITQEDEAFLRSVALRTWSFFRRFSQAEANWLVPDNVQEAPPAVAPRISPTNLGLLLEARLAACELGYLTPLEFVSATEKSLAAAKRLPRYHGHFLNWYDTRTLEPIEPLFVSTVDSGNLAGCLWTLKQGCLELSRRPIFRAALWRGIRDHLNVLDEMARAGAAPEEAVRALERLRAAAEPLQEESAAWMRELPALEQMALELEATLVNGGPGIEELRCWAAETSERLRRVREMLGSFAPWLLPANGKLFAQLELGPEQSVERLTLDSLPSALADLDARLEPCLEDQIHAEPANEARSLRKLLPECLRAAEMWSEKLKALATEADALVEQMDFGFLYDRRRKVLSVGYDVASQRLEASCYELLASEARTAAFVAVAKGDVPQESWFRLGRAHVLWKGQRVLLSWSGTMFEYLMPSLWMKSYPNTLLDQSLRAAVRCQQEIGKIGRARRRIPWGISEAASSERDSAGLYQYQAFGIAALAIKPAASDELVVSPYATCLALAVEAADAVRNLRHMQEMGWLGRFGFYESADFRLSRVKQEQGYELVRCWMAHHQGMSLIAVANLLADSALQDLFHAEARVAATERLLHERLPHTLRVESADEPYQGGDTGKAGKPGSTPDAFEPSVDAPGQQTASESRVVERSRAASRRA
jgi:cyclic beta-1,2-glucan synthetase